MIANNLLDELTQVLKNVTGELSEYAEIKKLINYFKGSYINELSS